MLFQQCNANTVFRARETFEIVRFLDSPFDKRLAGMSGKRTLGRFDLLFGPLWMFGQARHRLAEYPPSSLITRRFTRGGGPLRTLISRLQPLRRSLHSPDNQLRPFRRTARFHHWTTERRARLPSQLLLAGVCRPGAELAEPIRSSLREEWPERYPEEQQTKSARRTRPPRSSIALSR